MLPPAPNTSQACSSLSTYTFPGGTYNLTNPAYTLVPLSNTYATSLGNLNASSPLVSTVNCVRGVGSTAYAEALDAAVAELNAHGRANTQKVIVFLSDGGANDGPNYLSSTSPYLTQPCGQAVNTANTAKTNKVLIYSIAYNTGNEGCYMSPGAKRGTKVLTTSDYRRYAETSGYTSDSALQAIASNANNFYNQPDPSSLTGIFNQIGADIAAGTSRING